MAHLSNSPKATTLLTVEQRKAYSLGLWFRTKDQGSEPEGYDITGDTVRFVMAQQQYRGGAVQINELATIVDAENGYARLDLQGSDFDIAAGTYDFAITWTEDEYDTVVVKGEVEVLYNPDPTVEGPYVGENPVESLTLEIKDHDHIHVVVDKVRPPSLSTLPPFNLAPGNDPQAYFVGYYPHQQLQLGLVRGTDGVQGIPGEQGPDGEQGPVGPAGPVGPQGPLGPQGLQGPVGPVGPEGPEGPEGPDGPQGPVGPEGPQGPQGDPGLDGEAGIFYPAAYGADGNNFGSDDTVALQACFDAAAAVGGIVHLWNALGAGNYRVDGVLTFKRGTYVGASTDESSGDLFGTVIQTNGAGARVNFGTWAGDHNPSKITDVVIDGNGSGDPLGIVRVQAESATLDNIVIRDPADIGVVFDHAQNCSIHNLKILGADAGGAILMDNGAGGNQFYGGHLVNNRKGVKFVYDLGDPVGSQYTYGNKFYGMIIESYLAAGLTDNLIEMDSGFANGFFACQLGANIAPTNDLALVKIISGAIIPQCEFQSMWFSGHASAVDHAIDITGVSIASIVVDGFTTALNVASLVHTNTAQSAVSLRGDQRMVPGTIPVFTKSGAGTYTNHSRASAPVETEFVTAQTDTPYAIPPGAKYLEFECAGAGGGGGSGRRGTNLSAKGGGSGGGGGGFCKFRVPVSDLTDTIYVTVGAAGTGGAAVTVDDTNGNNGVAGGASYISVAAAPTIGQLVALANGGGAGLGGVGGAVSAGGGQGLGSMVGGNGGASVVTGTYVGGSSTIAGPGGAGQGGGAGGSIASGGGVIGAGGPGYPPLGRWNSFTALGGTSGGGAGGAGTSPLTSTAAGSGGGGGGAHNAGAGGAGGAGARCSGGGGGGAALNGNNSGAGGAGGLGYVKITAVFL